MLSHPPLTAHHRTKETGEEDSQRQQALDARLRSDRARDEREHRRARGAEARHPPDGARYELGRQDAARVVHDDREDGPEEEPDERDGDGAAEEGGHEPEDEREPDREQEVEEDRAVLADLRAGGSSWSVH